MLYVSYRLTEIDYSRCCCNSYYVSINATRIWYRFVQFLSKCIKTFPCRLHQKLNYKVFDPFKIKYNHNIKVCFLVSVKTKTKLRLIEILSKLF